MDSAQLAWIIAIIVVVLVILGLVFVFGRRRKQAKDHERAENLRQSAAADELNAREGEAKAARAAADAQQADVDAERLREEARNQAEEAQLSRTRAEEQAFKADSLDPETETSRRHRTDPSGTGQDQAGDPNQSEQPHRTDDARDNPGKDVTGP